MAEGLPDAATEVPEEPLKELPAPKPPKTGPRTLRERREAYQKGVKDAEAAGRPPPITGKLQFNRVKYQAEQAKKVDALNKLRMKSPSYEKRADLTQKAESMRADQQQALSRMLAARELPQNEANYAQVMRDTIIRSVQGGEDWEGFDDDEYQVINVYAMREMGKEYANKKDASDSFASDFMAYNEALRGAREANKKRGATRVLVGVSGGEEKARAERSDTVTDREIAELLPLSSEKTLYMDSTDPEVLTRISEGLTNPEIDDEKLELIFDNSVSRSRYTQNAYRPTDKARAMDAYIPVYELPERSHYGLDLGMAREALEVYYFNQIVKDRDITWDQLDDKKVVNEIRGEARELAKKDVAIVSTNSEAFVADSDPDSVIRDFLENRGVKGVPGKIPVVGKYLRPFAALTIAPRKAGGKFYRKGDEESGEYLVEPGVMVDWLGDKSLTSATDYLLRLAPSEAVGSAFHLAHKDYVEQFGDKAEGRGQWITAQMKKLWGTDRHLLEITHSMDAGGYLLTQAGPVLMGRFGDKHPTASAWMMGVPIFAAMILEPDPFWAAMQYGKAAKATGKVTGTAAKLLRARHFDSMRVGKNLLREELAKLGPEELYDLKAVSKAVDRARQKDTTGSVDVLTRIAATETGMTAEIGQDYVTLLKEAQRGYEGHQKSAAKLADDARASMDKAARNADELGQAKDLADAAQSIIRGKAEEIAASEKLYEGAVAKHASVTRKLASVESLRAFVSDDLPKMLKGSMGEKDAMRLRRALDDDQVQKYLAKKDYDIAALRADIDDAFPSQTNFGFGADAAAQVVRREALQKRIAGELSNILKNSAKERRARLLDMQKTAAKAVKEAALGTADLARGIRAALKSAAPDLVDTLQALKGGKALARGVETGETLGDLNKMADALEESIAGLEAKLQTTMRRYDKAAGDFAVQSKLSKEGYQQISRDTAEAFVSRLDSNLKAVEALDTTAGKALLRSMWGKSIEQLAEDTKFMKEGRKLGLEGLDELSDVDFVQALASAEFSRIMWESPSRFRKWSKSREFTAMNVFKDARVWASYARVQIRDLMDKFPVFTTNVRHIEIKVRDEVQAASKGISHRINRVMENMNLIAAEARNEQEIAERLTRYLCSTEQTTMRTASGLRELTLDGTAGLKDSIVRGSYDIFANIAEAEVKRGVTIENKALDSVIKAFISDQAPLGAKGAEAIEDLRKNILLRFSKQAEELREMSDPDLLQAMQKIIFEEAQVKNIAISFDELQGAYSRSKTLFYYGLVLGSMERKYADRLFDIVGTRHSTESVGRAMNYFMEEAAELASPTIRSFREGDVVIFKSDAVQFNRAYDKPVKTRVRPEAEVAGRKVRPPEKDFQHTRRSSRMQSDPYKGGKRMVAAEEVLFESGLGAGALRINKVVKEGDVEYAILQNGKKVPTADLVFRDPRLSMLDLYDGMLHWGPELVETIGRNSMKGATNEARGTYAKMVAHSMDESGNIRMIPRDVMLSWHKQLENIEKELAERVSAKALENPITRSVVATLPKMVQMWKQMVLFGLLVPRAAYFSAVVVGDWAQMVVPLGVRQATSLSMFGALGYLPYGKKYQDLWVKTSAKMKGLPLGPMMGAMFNPQLDKILRGEGYIMVKGKKMSTSDFLDEAIEAGINENIRTLDMAQISSNMARRNVARLQGGLEARNITKPEAMLREYTRIMEYTAREGTRRQRLALYAHLRVNKGMSAADAKKMLDESLYDWTHSISKFEANTFAKISAFYVFTKNAFAVTLRQLLDNGSTPTKSAMNRWFRGQTKQQRMKALIMLQENVLLRDQFLRPEEELSGEKLQDLSSERIPPRYLTEYPLLTMGTLSPTAQKIFSGQGVIKSNYARVIPKLTSVEFVNFYAVMTNIALGALAAASSSDKEFDQLKAFDRASEEIVDMMNPFASGVTENYLRGLKGRSVRSEYGPRIRQDEMELLSFFGLADSLREDDTGALRLSGYMNNLFLNTVLRPLKSEGTRGAYLWTILFGDKTEFTPADVKALREEGKDPRLEALASYLNIGRAFFYHGDASKVWQVKRMKDKLSLEENKARRYIDTTLGSEE